jgi:hypothetical protein
MFGQSKLACLHMSNISAEPSLIHVGKAEPTHSVYAPTILHCIDSFYDYKYETRQRLFAAKKRR